MRFHKISYSTHTVLLSDSITLKKKLNQLKILKFQICEILTQKYFFMDILLEYLWFRIDLKTWNCFIEFSHFNVIWKWSNFISVIMWCQNPILFLAFAYLRVTSGYLLLLKLSYELVFDSIQFCLTTRDEFYSKVSETCIDFCIHFNNRISEIQTAVSVEEKSYETNLV